MLAKTGGHYPAPLAAIEVVKHGTATTLAEGLALEARAFGRLAVTDVSRALVSIFFATQEIKKDTGVSRGHAGGRSRQARRAGRRPDGRRDRLRGRGGGRRRAAEGRLARGARRAGCAHVRGVYEERRKRRSLTGREVGQRMDRISPSLDLRGLRAAPTW